MKFKHNGENEDEDVIQDWVLMMLEDESLEDLLERFDLSPDEAFLELYKTGLVDDELLRELMRR